MFKTDAAPQPATSPDRAVPRKTVFLLLRVAIGIAVLAYLAKSGQINFSSLFPELLRSVSVLRRLLYIDALLAVFMLAAAALFMFFPPARSWVSALLGRWPGIKSIALHVLDAMGIHGKAQSRLFLALLLSLLANLALIVVTPLALYPVNPGS